ncbi:hypothetical protein GF373_15700, partial [bacterium]|nr:hypothetical protein [bacterium]
MNTIMINCSQAIERYFQGDTKGAEAILWQIIETHPHEIEPRLHLANLYFSLDRPNEVITLLEPVIYPPNNIPEIDKLFFHACYISGSTQKALPVFKRLSGLPDLDANLCQRLIDYALLTREAHKARHLARRFGFYSRQKEITWACRLTRILNTLPTQIWQNPIKNQCWKWFHNYRRRKSWVLGMAAWLADPSHTDWAYFMACHHRRFFDIYNPKWETSRHWFQLFLAHNPSHREAKKG